MKLPHERIRAAAGGAVSDLGTSIPGFGFMAAKGYYAIHGPMQLPTDQGSFIGLAIFPGIPISGHIQKSIWNDYYPYESEFFRPNGFHLR